MQWEERLVKHEGIGPTVKLFQIRLNLGRLNQIRCRSTIFTKIDTCHYIWANLVLKKETASNSTKFGTVTKSNVLHKMQMIVHRI